MAKLEQLIPHLLYRESGVKDPDPRRAFEKAAAKGVKTLRGDRGGPTMAGVTIGTYTDYCKRKGMPKPTVADLAAMTYEQWLDITKGGFWGRCHGDEIAYQPTANMLVDWAYTSGVKAIIGAQKALGVKADGRVGPITLAALNAGTLDVFRKLKAARLAYYRSIAVGSQAGFWTSWSNRTEAITPNGCLLR